MVAIKGNYELTLNYQQVGCIRTWIYSSNKKHEYTLKKKWTINKSLPEWAKVSHMVGVLPSWFAAPSTFHI